MVDLNADIDALYTAPDDGHVMPCNSSMSRWCINGVCYQLRTMPDKILCRCFEEWTDDRCHIKAGPPSIGESRGPVEVDTDLRMIVIIVCCIIIAIELVVAAVMAICWICQKSKRNASQYCWLPPKSMTGAS